jgi:hypothetical protein
MSPADDIQILDDAVGMIRRRPGMYMRAGATATDLAEALVHDALVLGAQRVLIERHREWTIVSADLDWLGVRGRHVHNLVPADLFRRIVPFPEDGVNAMRHEVLATAFASDVVSSTRTERLLVSGQISLDDEIWNVVCPEGLARGIGFRGVTLPGSPGGG